MKTAELWLMFGFPVCLGVAWVVRWFVAATTERGYGHHDHGGAGGDQDRGEAA